MNNILDVIKKSRKICITCHTSPDGDASGSLLALYLGLKSLGKEIRILSKDAIPKVYSFLPNSNLMQGEIFKVEEDTDLVIVLDCGNFHRINADLNLNEKNYILINIDHHLSNELYGDLNYVDTNSAAVGEIVYQMLKILGVYINKPIANCLYTSILTDTGSFRFSNTTSITHSIAGDLINCGVNVDQIYAEIFEKKPFERIKLQGAAIENMAMFYEGKLCLVTITKELLQSLNIVDKEYTSDALRIGMEIDSVEVVALLKETDEGVKISLRAKNRVDVRKIAEQFGGGGHTKASGLLLKNNIKAAEEIILKAIENELI